MNPKIRPEHLTRTAVVYVRQSSPGQVEHHTESQHLQYSLATTGPVVGLAHTQNSASGASPGFRCFQ